MKLLPITNETKLYVLQSAKVWIEDGHSGFICYALEDSMKEETEYKNVVKCLQNFIHEQLDGAATLLGYIINQKINNGMMLGIIHAKQCRLAWLDRLIADLEN